MRRGFTRVSMNRTRRIYIAKSAVILSVVPVLVWAYAAGPDVGKAGVPGESTCAEAGCHAGTVNSGSGSVSVIFPTGMTYVPGVKQRLLVRIADAAQRVWGFQLTARQAANTRTQAGSFTSADRFTGVVCGQTATDPGQVFLDFPNSQVCPANKPLAYIEHTDVGSRRVQTGSQTYQFDWTPPATDVGDVRIFVSGNAGNGDGNNTGDRIYTANYTLTPAAAPPAPQISANGVQNGASFEPGLVPGSWFTIKGAALSSTTNTWDNFIVGGQLPASLNGVSVSVGGKPAYVYFVSPTQVNAVAPGDAGTGSMPVTVTNSGSTSAAATVNATTFGPAFFPWPGNQAVATRQDFSLAVKNGTFAGATTTAAKPGEVIILWGTGFGPTNPATPQGVQVPASAFPTANPVTVSVGGTPAEVFGAALAPGFAALYQVAIRIPASAPDGDLPLIATISGVPSPASTVISVKR